LVSILEASAIGLMVASPASSGNLVIAQNCGNIEIRPSGQNLTYSRGQSWTTCSGYRFIFQNDSNLVLYSGVDGCLVGRCDRNENWSESVPQSVINRVRGYAILQQHEPSWRIFDRANQFLDWLNSDDGKATVGTIATIAAML
jgi:hypothetical protein